MLTPADDVHHINKHNFKVPFVCGCRDLGEALRRIAEGAAMIRTKVIFLAITGAARWCRVACAFRSSLDIAVSGTPQLRLQLALATQCCTHGLVNQILLGLSRPGFVL